MEEQPTTPMPQPTAPQPGPAGPKRLVRSRRQRMFLGVCGGLGEYFNVDPTIIRVIFVVTLALGGSSLLVYAVLAAVMPAEDAADLEPREAAKQTLDEAVTEGRKAIDWAAQKIRSLLGR